MEDKRVIMINERKLNFDKKRDNMEEKRVIIINAGGI